LSGDYPRSLAALDLLAKREPPAAGIWWVRATCYDKLGRKPEALAAYQKFLELNTNLNSDEYFVAASRARLLQREIRDKKK
jgi:tetratricopeptide (TPR) repeat protein